MSWGFFVFWKIGLKYYVIYYGNWKFLLGFLYIFKEDGVWDREEFCFYGY